MRRPIPPVIAAAAALSLLGACDRSPTRPELQPEGGSLAARTAGLAQPTDFSYEIVRHPDAGHTFLNRMNARGDLVGDYCAADFSWCWGFTKRGASYETIAFPGSLFTYAYGINERGDVVGEYGDGTGEHAYLYSRGDYRPLSAPEGVQTRAYDISATGVISGSYRGPLDVKWQPAIWEKDGRFVPLPDLAATLGADMAEAFGINVHGAIVGHFTRADDTATPKKMYGFIYQDGFVSATLNFPGSGWMSCAWGIGAQGAVLGHYVDLEAGGVTGYLWSDGAFLGRLRAPDAANTFPQSITPNGTIAGYARLTTGERVGFIARR